MNYEYKQGDKVRVTVNGASWEDEISYNRAEQFCGNETVLKLSDDLYRLKSGVTVPESALTPIIPEIKPEPGDIVKVWNERGTDQVLKIFDSKSNGSFSCSDIHSCISLPWDHCRVLARKPKRWEEMAGGKRNQFVDIITKLSNIASCSILHEQMFLERYKELISIILGGAPYARIDE